MPTYTYRADCGHEWDEVRSLAEDSQTSAGPCPTCLEDTGSSHEPPGSQAQHGRKIVPTGVSAHFKGAGWTPKFYRNRMGK